MTGTGRPALRAARLIAATARSLLPGPSLEEAFTMPRDACGDRLPERFLDVGAATVRVTRCFQFPQVVSLQSCRTTPRCYDSHPQPEQPRSGCSAPARPAEYAIRTSRRFGDPSVCGPGTRPHCGINVSYGLSANVTADRPGYARASSSTGMVRTPAVCRAYSAKPG